MTVAFGIKTKDINDKIQYRIFIFSIIQKRIGILLQLRLAYLSFSGLIWHKLLSVQFSVAE